MKFVDDTKLERGTDRSGDRAAAQRDLDRMEGWASRNPMKFCRNKSNIMCLGGKNPLQWWRLGSSCAGTALGFWQRAEQEPAPCHGSEDGQQHPGLL